MKKKHIGFIVTVVAVALVAGVYRHHQTNAVSVDQSTWVKAEKVKVTVLPHEVHAIGALSARSVDITPELTGHIEKINFHDGASVNEGDVLIELDNAIYKAKLTTAEAHLKLSELNYHRLIALSKKGMISKQAFDQAEADLKEKKAELAEATAMLSKTKLSAPFEGVMGKSNVSVGDYVNNGQKLVTLTDISPLRIEYNLPEKYLAALAIGQTVSVKSAAYPDQLFTAKVSFIAPMVNKESRTISLYAELPNEKKQLIAGMFVDVSHSLGADENAIMVPERSLVPVLDGQELYKVVDGKAYSVTAMTGRRQNGYIQIVDGLKPDDMVITDGQLKIKNGVPVKVKS